MAEDALLTLATSTFTELASHSTITVALRCSQAEPDVETTNLGVSMVRNCIKFQTVKNFTDHLN